VIVHRESCRRDDQCVLNFCNWGPDDANNEARHGAGAGAGSGGSGGGSKGEDDEEGKNVAAGFVYKDLGTRIRGNKQICSESTLIAVAYSNSKILEYTGQHYRRDKHAEKVKAG